MGLVGILLSLALLVGLAYRGWSVLLIAPAAALIAAAAAREPLLAHWTQTFMGSAAGFLAQFFPLFLLGALFGKLMEDSGSVEAIARFMTDKLGPQRAILAVVLAGALVTYGGGSLFVALFLLAPAAQGRERATVGREFDPAEIRRGHRSETVPSITLAILPLVVVIAINLLMSLIVLPRLAAEMGIDPALMHRVAVIGAGTLDSLPHNGAVVSLLAVCGSTHRESYFDIVIVGIAGAMLALLAVIALGTVFGSF